MVAKTKKSRKSKSKAQPEEMDVAPAKEEVVSASAKKQGKKTKKSAEKSQPKKVTKSKKQKKSKVEEPPPAAERSSGSDEEEEGSDDMKLTLEALDAMSDDDDDDDSEDGDDIGSDGDGGEMSEEDYDAEALALRKMIQDGKFDAHLKKHGKKSQEEKKKHPDGKKKNKKSKQEESEEEEGDEDASMENAEDESEKQKDNDGAQPEQEEDSDSEDEDEEKAKATSKKSTQAIALTTALAASNRHLPWAETFAIVPPTPLPFAPSQTTAATAAAGTKRKLDKTTVDGVEYDEDFVKEDEEEYVDIHDDLKREVAFYDNALEAVTLAREQCETVGIPFTRPEDFFAEMVKSDDHMAKIKDRLIFETKKMEAVERRKSNKEQTVMAKERHAHRLAEKAKSKKAHMSAVDQWKKDAERNRSGLGGKVKDWQDDEDQLQGRFGGGANTKRMAADKRFGHGGKRGRFKQNDKQTLNDMSGYNPRGGFGGVGQKSQGGKGKKGGKKRPGKRARDSAR